MQPAKFTKENPCTKCEIFNAFWDKGFKPTPLVSVRAVIGLNVPKYLRREGFAVESVDKNVDMMTLTQKGESWLLLGLRKHLERHPGDLEKCTQPPPWLAPAPVHARVIPRRRAR